MSVQRRNLMVAAFGSALGVPALTQARVDPGSTLRIGQSLPLSGPHAVLGTAYRNSALAAFRDLTRQGWQGPRIELVSLDDGGEPERTAVNVKLLAAEHGVQALFGFVGGGADRAGSRAAAAEGLPYVAPASGSVELRSALAPGTFTFRASHADEMRHIARHVETIGVTTLALVNEYNFLGWELRDTALELLHAGIQRDVVLTSIDREGSAYSLPGVVEVILAKGPQAVVLGSNAVASAAVVRAARTAGFKGYFYALSSVGTQGLGELLGPLVAGISVTQVVPFALSGKSAVARTHRAFCARHGITPSAHSMEAWLAATLMVEAMKRLDRITPAAIAQALSDAPPVDFGDYSGQWQRSRPHPRPFVSLTVHDRSGRLIE